MLLLLSLACSAPVEAPEDFNELLSYLFEHTMNEDSETSCCRCEQLAEHLLQTTKRCCVKAMPWTTSLKWHLIPQVKRSHAGDTYGVTLQYSVGYSIENLAYANTAADGMDVYPANYLSYERENLTDFDCFLERRRDLF